MTFQGLAIASLSLEIKYIFKNTSLAEFPFSKERVIPNKNTPSYFVWKDFQNMFCMICFQSILNDIETQTKFEIIQLQPS